MNRLTILALAIGCSSSTPAQTPPQVVTTPAVKPAAPVAPTELPSLATAEAVRFLPDTTSSVAAARSADEVAALLSDAPIFEGLTGLVPGGLSRRRPIGIAFVEPDEYEGEGWIAFAYVDDAKAFDASVPANRRTRRGELAFFASSAATLRQVRPAIDTKHRRPDLASQPEFATSLAKLHLGALLSWWTEYRGAAGIAITDTTLFVSAPEGISSAFGVADHATAINRAAALAALALMGSEVPPAVMAKQQRANQQLDDLDRELDVARDAVIDDLAKQLGISTRSSAAIDRTFTVPAATVKAWLAPFVERWRATALQAKRDAIDREVVAIERQIDRLPSKHIELPDRRPSAVLGSQILDPSGSSTTHSGGGSRGDPRTGTR